MSIIATTDDQTFILYCKQEIDFILAKDSRENLDYLKFYVYLHFILEISISFLFRQFVLLHVFFHTPERKISINEIDEMKIQDKITLLKNFSTRGIEQGDVEKLIGWYNNFAEKRNKIAHGYWIGKTYNGTDNSNSKTMDWLNDSTLNLHLNLYTKIIQLLRECIDKLPCLTDTGKKDMKESLNNF